MLSQNVILDSRHPFSKGQPGCIGGQQNTGGGGAADPGRISTWQRAAKGTASGHHEAEQTRRHGQQGRTNYVFAY